MAKKKKNNKEQEALKNEGQEQEVLEGQEEQKVEEGNEEVVEEEALSAEEKLQNELEESKDKYLRLYSEFENFRRRTAKERLELTKVAISDVVVDLLSVVDDFERAQVANEQQEDIAVVKEGFDLINHKLFKALEQRGLKLMKTEKGDDFDAELHEAITQFPTDDEKLKGKIVDTVEKGYYLGEKVVRFAKVVIGA